MSLWAPDIADRAAAKGGRRFGGDRHHAKISDCASQTRPSTTTPSGERWPIKNEAFKLYAR